MIASSDQPRPGKSSGDPLTLCYIDEKKGLGVRTLVNCKAGEVIHHFTGEIRAEIEQHSLQISQGGHICGTEYIGFLPHSCAPNCRLDMDGFRLITLRDIYVNDVLTVDYAATEDYLYRQFACHCGASHCRNWITGRREPVDPHGTTYLESLNLSQSEMPRSGPSEM